MAGTTAYRHGYSVTGPDGGRLSLPIEVCVIDTGPGATADVVDHLFEPFVTSKPKGSGLGLALVDKLVADHGGVVEYARECRPATTAFHLLLTRPLEPPKITQARCRGALLDGRT